MEVEIIKIIKYHKMINHKNHLKIICSVVIVLLLKIVYNKSIHLNLIH
jgi:hypothetical protein